MRSILLPPILFYLFALLLFPLDIAQRIESSPSVSQPPSPMSPTCSFCGNRTKSLTAHHAKCEVRLKDIQLGRQRNKEQRNLSRAAASGARARSGASGPNSIASSSTSNPVTVAEEPRALPVAEEGDTEMHVYEPPAPLIVAPMASGNRRILRSSRHQPPTVSDVLPETAMPLPRTIPAYNIPDSHDGPSAPAASTVSVLHRIRLVVRESFTTASNKFGITRVYCQRPIRIPDIDLPVDCILDDTNATGPPAGGNCMPPEIPDEDAGDSSLSPWFPFPNFSVFQLQKYWWARGPTKSKVDRDALLAMLRLPNFKNADLDVVKDWDKMDALMDKAAKGKATDGDAPNSESIGDGWIPTTIPIQVPLAGKASSQRSAEFMVPGFHRRRIMPLIRDVLTSNPAAKGFHFEPFRQYWTSPTDPKATTQRIYDELYSSDAFNTEHEALQRKPRPALDVIPRAIAALMLSSDSTHLTSFGNTKIWPLYLAFGNQTKYERARPSEYAMHHLAYLPSLPDTFQDFVKERSGVSAQPAIVTLCRRLLMHGALRVLLDDEFVDAYDHGLVMKCADGVVRRIYPRIFTYSADYPEKVLLATIRDMGTCPCPRCFVQKVAIDQLGTVEDTTTRSSSRQDTSLWRRKVNSAIYWIGMGYVVGSKRVENLLHAESWVPVENAFSRLSRFGFNVFSMLVVDILHELDLGVWKSLFTHLVHMLEAQGQDKLAIANHRFRHVPPFGVDTIRRFRNDVTAMRKLAGRDFEDILLCAIPVLEGLFPKPFDEQIMSLLFTLAYWYSLAKLRMHLSSTLRVLSDLTTDLGVSLRSFRDEICSKFNTHETTREYQARQRRALKQNASTAPGRAAKGFNLSTFKLHSLGDYVKSIQAFGTTDSYSTQMSELAHKFLKSRYARTNKNDAQDQIAKLERREYFLRQMDQRTSQPHPVHDNEDIEDLPDPEAHHFIAKSRRAHFQLFEWLYLHAGDPAIEFFTVRLQDYLLSKLRGSHYEGNESSFTAEDREAIDIRNDTIFTHNIAHFNYTTYDVRRARDIINLRPGHPELPAKRDIMVIANEDTVPGQPSHPFWYARVLGIFHVDVRDTVQSSPRYRRQEMLWVRWYGRDIETPAGWDAKRLDRLGFEGFGPEHPEAFGFLDPAQVLRGAHIIPGFAHGRDADGLPPSSLAVEDEGDWNVYYVNRFADRDMVMRYMGGGVGHALQLQPCDFGANPPQQVFSVEEAELFDSADDPNFSDGNLVEMDDMTILGGEGDDLEDRDELPGDDLEHDWDIRSDNCDYSDDDDVGYESEDNVFGG